MKMMNILALFLSFYAVAGLDNHTVFDDPARYMAAQKDSQWFAYRVKAQDNTRSMCCWDQSRKNNSQCYLEKQSYGYGNTDDSAITENISLYVKLKKGQLEKILTVGDHCNVVTGGQQVNWLKGVSQRNSLEWLKDAINSDDEHINSSALHAVALHESDQASNILYGLASGQDKHRAENAVFWLGESRNDGFGYLKKLYEELPNGQVKRQINFGLSLSHDSQSIDLLKKIAKQDGDEEQRADAMFWLAQNKIMGIESLLMQAIKDDESMKVREKAIFSLAEVNSPAAKAALLDLATNKSFAELNDGALFWLAHVSPVQAKGVVFDVLKSSNNENAIHQAVFTLTQLSGEDNDQALFEVIRGNYSQMAKKQALFWLSQSDNHHTIDKLRDLLSEI